MSDPFHNRPLPRGPLLGAVALVVFTIVLVAYARLTGYVPVGAEPSAYAVAERSLRFEDRLDGSIAVYDAGPDAGPDAGADVEPVTVLAPGTHSFLRSTLRGLARERRQYGIGPEIPFRIYEQRDGRLVLLDPATGRSIDLKAFGPDNWGVFARFLSDNGGDTRQGAGHDRNNI